MSKPQSSEPAAEDPRRIPTRELGRSGLRVSSVGFGCLSISGFYGAAGRGDADRIVARALDLGVTLFDVADIYAFGEGERRLGRALRGRREHAIVATKFGQRYGTGGEFLGVDGTPAYVRVACEASLARLGLETIDLYQLHRIDPGVPVEETVGAMRELVDEGKVRFLGLSEAVPSDLRRAVAAAPIASLQSEYSLLERSVEDEVLDTCEELGIGFLAYAPLLRGVLGDRYSSTDELQADDPRRAGRYPRVAGDALVRNRELAAVVRAIAEDHAVTPAQVALAWLLARRGWIVPLPGTRQVRYLEDNAAAAQLQLDSDAVARLDSLVPAGGGGAGARYEAGLVTTRVSPPTRVTETPPHSEGTTA
jgi:aryl-alcohol dehydrogenase-like predicted oxidoreductase